MGRGEATCVIVDYYSSKEVFMTRTNNWQLTFVHLMSLLSAFPIPSGSFLSVHPQAGSTPPPPPAVSVSTGTAIGRLPPVGSANSDSDAMSKEGVEPAPPTLEHASGSVNTSRGTSSGDRGEGSATSPSAAPSGHAVACSTPASSAGGGTVGGRGGGGGGGVTTDACGRVSEAGPGGAREGESKAILMAAVAPSEGGREAENAHGGGGEVGKGDVAVRADSGGVPRAAGGKRNVGGGGLGTAAVDVVREAMALLDADALEEVEEVEEEQEAKVWQGAAAAARAEEGEEEAEGRWHITDDTPKARGRGKGED